MTAYQQGIKDYAAGRPFPLIYEKWSEEAQQSYERGRLMQAKKMSVREPAKTLRAMKDTGR